MRPGKRLYIIHGVDILLLISFMVSVIFIGLYIDIKLEQKQAEKENRAIQERFKIAEESIKDSEIVNEDITIPVYPGDIDKGFPPVATEKPKEVMKEFIPLLKMNDDIIGWIKIPGTGVDFPVMQSTDNDYYLHHSFTNKPLYTGAIFMDFRNNWQEIDNNLIIYGHTFKKDNMFSYLNYYVQNSTKDDYAKNNNIIKLDTLYEKTEWEIFSAYVVQLNKEQYYLFPSYPGKEFTNYINEIQKRSIIDTNIEIKPDDKILTLVTCHPPIKNSRTIIHARLVKED